ncbi:family A G protein-coupled receptor-like protein, partial [Ascodesmis nigricans]
RFSSNNITTHGSNVDWAICALHCIIFVGVLAWTYITASTRRIFHYIATAILLITTIYYFVMASDLGATAVPVEFRRYGLLGRTRQIFYTRWIGYFLNFSLIWFALLLLSGVGWGSIIYTVGLVMLWALMFLLGALVASSYKWGFWIIAVVLYFLICWQVMGVARRFASRVSTEAGRIFLMLAGWELLMMLLYPIAWACCEGGNKITNDTEQAFYAVLDTLSQGAFAVALLFLTRALDFDAHRLSFHEDGRIHNDRIHGEKHRPVQNGVQNGVVQDGVQNGVPAGGNVPPATTT